MDNLIDNKQIKVFVSSTFKKMEDERDCLTYKIFPSVRHFCEKRGYDFIDIDLRWGISAQDSLIGHVLEICLNEINNTKPFFLGIVGDRYGWVPTRKQINDVDKLIETYPQVDTYLNHKYSITEMEMMFGVLDSNKYYNAIFFVRKCSFEESSEGGKKLKTLRNKIKSQSKYPVIEYQTIEEFESSVDNFFIKNLENICVDYLKKDSEYENLQNQFEARLLSNYLPNQCQIDFLDMFLSDSSRTYYVLYGDSGCGKSSLMAYYGQLTKSRNENWEVIRYYSESVIKEEGSVLSYLNSCITRILNGSYQNTEATSYTIEEERQRLDKLMNDVEKKGIKLLVMLDLTQLSWQYYLDDWALNKRNGANIKFILALKKDLSLQYDIENSIAFRKKDFMDKNFFAFNTEYKKIFIAHYFKYYSKTLPHPSLIDEIALSEIDTPQSLVMTLNELRKYGDYDTFAEHLKLVLSTYSSGELMQYIIQSMAKKYDTEDCVFVKDFFGYLSVDKYFTESEIVDILGIPQEKRLIFYRFFRASSLWYRMVNQYIVLTIDKRYTFYYDGDMGSDNLHGRLTEMSYSQKIVDFFVANHKKYLYSARIHLFAHHKRRLAPYYEPYRKRTINGSLEDNEWLICEYLLASCDLPDGQEYSTNVYLRVKCIDNMNRINPDLLNNEKEYYLNAIDNWIYHFYSKHTLDEVIYYCTDKEQNEIAKIYNQCADDCEELEIRLNKLLKNLEYHKVTSRAKSLLKNETLCTRLETDEIAKLEPNEGTYPRFISKSIESESFSCYFNFSDAEESLKTETNAAEKEIIETEKIYLEIFKENRKYGFKDEHTGEIIIQPKYNNVWKFSEGLAQVVALNDKIGFINKNGEEVIPAKYEDADSFSEGLAPVKLNGKWGFIDKSDRQIIPFRYGYDYAEPFSQGLAPVKINSKWGFIDKSGKEIIPIMYDEVLVFCEGLAIVELNGEEIEIDFNEISN